MRFPDLDEFTAAGAETCYGAPTMEQDGPNGLVMTDDDADGLLVYGIAVGADPGDVMERVKEVMVGEHHFAGMATTVSWSPDERPTFDAWCLTTVERGKRARCSIIRMGVREWYDIDMIDAPWFVLSTAGSLRGWLEGEFTDFKAIPDGDRSLFGKPLDGGPVPPTDKRGRI